MESSRIRLKEAREMRERRADLRKVALLLNVVGSRMDEKRRCKGFDWRTELHIDPCNNALANANSPTLYILFP